MINTSDEKDRAKTAKEAEARTRRRAEQAQIVAGLQSVLESDEQLLGFSRETFTCNCVNAVPHARQNLPTPPGMGRLVTHKSQKYFWHLPQRKRAAVLGCDLHTAGPAERAASSGASGARGGGVASWQVRSWRQASV